MSDSPWRAGIFAGKSRFQVYESRTIALAAGDMVRISPNGFTREGRRLNNGDLKQVKGFTPDGDIRLSNGWVISKEYGYLTQGYCVTSYGSQSKVLIVCSSRKVPNPSERRVGSSFTFQPAGSKRS